MNLREEGKIRGYDLIRTKLLLVKFDNNEMTGSNSLQKSDILFPFFSSFRGLLLSFKSHTAISINLYNNIFKNGKKSILTYLIYRNVLQCHPSSQRSTKQKYSQVFCSDI